jgi:cytochrome c biogenesis protein CcdA
MSATLLAAFGAGMLSVLSPCVLPLLPILAATAAAEGRAAPLALAAGLAVSFSVTGIALATIGFAAGLDGEHLRVVAGVLLVALGATIAVPALRTRASAALGRVGELGGRGLGRVDGTGAVGQFVVGALLGIAWSPCVGPTLGAASLLAARGETLGTVAVTMGVFALGAVTPLLILGALPDRFLGRARGWMGQVGWGAGPILGGGLVLVGSLVVTGIDKRIETWLVDAAPDWLTRLSVAL